jgi:integrase
MSPRTFIKTLRRRFAASALGPARHRADLLAPAPIWPRLSTIEPFIAFAGGEDTNRADDELITRNVAAGIKLPRQRKRPLKPWKVEEARRFLVSALEDRDPRYAAFVLILVLGLRRGEILGLRWSTANLDDAEIGVYRTGGQSRVGGHRSYVLALHESEQSVSTA